MNESEYSSWWDNRTADEIKLQMICYECEEKYFNDMTMQIDSIAYDIVEVLQDMYDYIPFGLDGLCVRFFVVDGFDDPDTLGQYDIKNRTISVKKENLDNKGVILHEMLHFYLCRIEEINHAISEYLLLKFYEDLKKKIPSLDSIILSHADIYTLHHLESYGGRHGILFLLKSLDLDLRCGYKLGTVFGYGKEEELSD